MSVCTSLSFCICIRKIMSRWTPFIIYMIEPPINTDIFCNPSNFFSSLKYSELIQTIGLDFFLKRVGLPDGQEVALQVRTLMHTIATLRSKDLTLMLGCSLSLQWCWQVWDIGGQQIGGKMLGASTIPDCLPS